jgi:polyhydroxybutyrate depolymerase
MSPRIVFLGFLLFSSRISAQIIEEVTLFHDGLERTYIVYVPAIYNEDISVPLVINIHGLGSNATEQMIYGNFTAIADTANFIVVHPNGTEDGDGQTFWNAFSEIGVDDVGFISAIIDDVSNEYNIDANCVYSTGMSNGGFMSYFLACHLSERITAIASVTGSMVIGLPETCNAQHPTPVMEIHGTADGVVPYNGSIISESIDDVVDYWVSYNNCNTAAEFSEIQDIVTGDDCTAEHYVYTNGDMGATVEHYKVLGGEHSWPGAIINLNVTNMDFNASTEIWRFFRKYKLDMLTSISNPVVSEPMISVFPNPGNGIYTLKIDKNSEYTLNCYDVRGQLVHSSFQNSPSVKFELPTPGLYLISVTDGTQTERIRVVYE